MIFKSVKLFHQPSIKPDILFLGRHLLHSLALLAQNLLHILSFLHSSHPSTNTREVAQDISNLLCIVHRHQILPRYHAQVCISTFVPNKPVPTFQCFLQNTGYPSNFIGVPLDSNRLRRRRLFEPEQLAIVRTLAGHLEMEPLLGVVLFGEGFVAQFV